MQTFTFAQLVQQAHESAVTQAFPGTPSPAQFEAAYTPVVDYLRTMSFELACAYIRATWSRHAAGQAWVVEKLKDAMTINLSESMRSGNDACSYIAEASELGWAPGHWPEAVYVATELGRRLVLRDTLTADGATYSANGLQVRVFND